MTEIPFIKYLRPSGRPVAVFIDRPDEIASKAHKIIEAGYHFECEELRNGTVSLTITDDECDHAIQLCRNDAEVPAAVDRLVMRFTNSNAEASS